MARKRSRAATGRKKIISPKQKSARRKNMAIARKALKAGMKSSKRLKGTKKKFAAAQKAFKKKRTKLWRSESRKMRRATGGGMTRSRDTSSWYKSG